MAYSKLQRFVEFILDNMFDMIALAVASTMLIRHQIHPYGLNEIVDLSTGILAVMGFLAISGLWDRNRSLNRIERLSRQSRDLVHRKLNESARAEDFFISERSKQLSSDDFASAADIFICGITLTRTSREYMHTLSQRLLVGATIRFVVLDPTNDGILQELALRSIGDTTAEYWRNRLETVITIIQAISKTPGSTGTVSIGYLPYIPSFGLILLDSAQPRGFGFVELYHHKSMEPTPTFEIKAAEDSHWYSYFKRQCEVLWASCRTEQGPRVPESLEKTFTAL